MINIRRFVIDVIFFRGGECWGDTVRDVEEICLVNWGENEEKRGRRRRRRRRRRGEGRGCSLNFVKCSNPALRSELELDTTPVSTLLVPAFFLPSACAEMSASLRAFNASRSPEQAPGCTRGSALLHYSLHVYYALMSRRQKGLQISESRQRMKSEIYSKAWSCVLSKKQKNIIIMCNFTT